MHRERYKKDTIGQPLYYMKMKLVLELEILRPPKFACANVMSARTTKTYASFYRSCVCFKQSLTLWHTDRARISDQFTEATDTIIDQVPSTT